MGIATPSAWPAGLTGDLVIDAMTSGHRWTLGFDRTIDFSVSSGFNGEYFEDPQATLDLFEFVLSAFSDYANIRFNPAGVFANPTAANLGGSELNFSLDSDGYIINDTDLIAVGIPPGAAYQSIYPGAPGDILLNLDVDLSAITSYDIGSLGWALMLHEIGHVLGLKHTHDDGGTGHPTLADVGLGDVDFNWMSIMSYEDAYLDDQLHFNPATPMVLDVLALQYLYGPNMSAGVGDTTYTIRAVGLYATIWDAAGVDTISAATSEYGWYVQMPDVQYSTLSPALVGFAVPMVELNLDAPGTLFWLLGDLENLTGSAHADELIGNVHGNRIFGAAGDDTIEGGDGANYLRGDEGNDRLTGGSGFDDINGNMGDDVARGGAGGDWVVGGKDRDLLNGDDGNDIVYGNLGDDTCFGDAGADTVRGGQQNDVIDGGAGGDWLSGDRGDDTVTGGTGADLFHTFGDAGVDRVTDFNLAEGDRVLLDPGTVYTVAQSGADVVIDMTGGGRMVLVGVSMASLTGDWIFGA